MMLSKSPYAQQTHILASVSVKICCSFKVRALHENVQAEPKASFHNVCNAAEVSMHSWSIVHLQLMVFFIERKELKLCTLDALEHQEWLQMNPSYMFPAHGTKAHK